MSSPRPSPADPPGGPAEAGGLAERLRDGDRAALDLRGARLAGADLSGLDLSRLDLGGADLTRADLSRARLAGANLRGASLFGACLDGCELLAADLQDASLDECSARSAGFGGANLGGVKLNGAKLAGGTFSHARLGGAELRCADLQGARFVEAELDGADLSRADLREADLCDARVAGADFGGSDLRGAHLARLVGFESAGWIDVDVRDADFRNGMRLRRHILDENYLHEFRTQSRAAGALYWLWWATSDCGRSIARWGLWIALVVVLFAGIFAFLDVVYGPHPTFLSPLDFSVVTLTTLGYGDVLPASAAAQWVVILEVVTGYMALGGLISIFANKIARRAE